MHSTPKSVSHHHRKRKAHRLAKSKGSILHRIKSASGKYKKYVSADKKRAKNFRHALTHDNGPKKGKIRRLIKSAPKKLRTGNRIMKTMHTKFIRSL